MVVGLRSAFMAADNSDMRHQHGTALVRGSRVISVGHNKVGSAPGTFTWSRHSEFVATRGHDCDGATIVNVRKRRDGTIGMAKPCRNCQKYLKSIGVKRVIYTTGDGLLTEQL